MPSETAELRRLTFADHPENRAANPTEASPNESEPVIRPIGLGRAFFGMGVGGLVGSVLTILTVAFPLGAGDTLAAMSMLPLALVLIAIVNGWIAVNLFVGSGLHK